MAQAYLDTVVKVAGDPVLDMVLDRYDAVVARSGGAGAPPGASLTDLLRRDLFSDAWLGPVARNIVKMWYRRDLVRTARRVDGGLRRPGRQRDVHGVSDRLHRGAALAGDRRQPTRRQGAGLRLVGAPAAHPRRAMTDAPATGPSGRIRFGRETTGVLQDAERLEWLVTNGIGGYGSGTVAGSVTRGYHGLLVAARRPPVDRRVMLVKLDETVTYRDQTFELATNRWASEAVAPTGNWNLDAFELEGSVPLWRYACADAVLEKRVWMTPGANTTYTAYTLATGSAPAQLSIRAIVDNRVFHNTGEVAWPAQVTAVAGGLQVVSGGPDSMPLVLLASAGQASAADELYQGYLLPAEADRGLNDVDSHVHAGTFTATVAVGGTLTLLASAESDARLDPQALAQRRASRRRRAVGVAARPSRRRRPGAGVGRAPGAGGRPVRRVAPAPPGQPDGAQRHRRLPLVRRLGPRHHDRPARPDAGHRPARGRARASCAPSPASSTRGCCPTASPTGEPARVQHRRRHAVVLRGASARYLAATGDDASAARAAARRSTSIVRLAPARHALRHPRRPGRRPARRRRAGRAAHLDGRQGRRLGRHPADRQAGRDQRPVVQRAASPWPGSPTALGRARPTAYRDHGAGRRARRSSGSGTPRPATATTCSTAPTANDPALRPNQLLALSLPAARCRPSATRAVVDACARALLTSPACAAWRPPTRATSGATAATGARATAPITRARCGPGCSARSSRPPARAPATRTQALALLAPLGRSPGAAGLGSISEIFDGDAPFAPRGCIAQAWSVAEVLRAYAVVERLRGAATEADTDTATARASTPATPMELAPA